MESYKIPASDATAEFTEKKSRFIGNIFCVSSAQQAADIIKSMQKQFWDATHNVYAYILKDGTMRFSDDGEPQGTAGMPTLEVLKKEQVFDVLCVTTRYFGGILLGAGGLVRAYAHSAKIALDAAGVAVMQPYAVLTLDCHYSFLESVRKCCGHFGAMEESADFGAEVRLTVCLPASAAAEFAAKITDITNGRVVPRSAGEKMMAVPLQK